MNCYFHPQVEAVATCGKCGVAMCKECEEKALVRLDGGKGQALCNRCGLDMVQENVAHDEAWIRKRLVKLIIMAILIGIGAIVLAANLTELPAFTAFICWLVAGIIGNIGIEKKQGGGIIGMIVTSILSPIILFLGVVGLLRTLTTYKNDRQLLETIKAAVNN
ncbi:MAG: hypothetical protein ILP18_12305 [Treponema sp.]|nr:hypothetical protein [Treponema sp.]